MYTRGSPELGSDGLPHTKPYVIFQSQAQNLMDLNGDGKINAVGTEDNITNAVSCPGGVIDTTCYNEQLYIRDVFGIDPVQEDDDGLTVMLTHRWNNKLIPANGKSTHPVVSSNGRWVAFVSTATDLIDNGVSDTNGFADIYLLDRDSDGNGRYWGDSDYTGSDTHQFYIISRISNMGALADNESRYPTLTLATRGTPAKDYLMIAFHSLANNLSNQDTDGIVDVFYWEWNLTDYSSDITQSTLSLVSSMLYDNNDTPNNPLDDIYRPGNRHSLNPNIAPNGDLLAYTSYSNNLIEEDLNDSCEFFGTFTLGEIWTNCPDNFMRILPLGETWRISLTNLGNEALAQSAYPLVSSDGQYATFISLADLIGEGNQISSYQVFLKNQGKSPGNPNVQPGSWRFFFHEGEPLSKVVTLRFIGDLTFSNSESAVMYFQNDLDASFTISNDTCSIPPPFVFHEGDQCAFQVDFNANTHHNQDVTLIIPVTKLPGEINIEIPIRGIPVAGYNPLIVDTLP
jgi:hypothetical protein